MSNKSNIEFTKELEIYFKAKEIYESDMTWEQKYDLIFSEEISSQVYFDYYDPDCGYEDDVIAFMGAFKEYIQNKLEKVIL